jgi:hypothetical protein
VGTAGVVGFARDPDWSEYNPYNCNTPGSLYCLGDVVVLFWDGFELTHDLSRWSATSP